MQLWGLKSWRSEASKLSWAPDCDCWSARRKLRSSIHLHLPFLLGDPSHWWWARGGRRARAESCWCPCDEEITCTLSRWCEEATKQFWEAPARNLVRWHWLVQGGVGCSPPHLTLHNVACPRNVTCSSMYCVLKSCIGLFLTGNQLWPAFYSSCLLHSSASSTRSACPQRLFLLWLCYKRKCSLIVPVLPHLYLMSCLPPRPFRELLLIIPFFRFCLNKMWRKVKCLCVNCKSALSSMAAASYMWLLSSTWNVASPSKISSKGKIHSRLQRLHATKKKECKIPH